MVTGTAKIVTWQAARRQPSTELLSADHNNKNSRHEKRNQSYFESRGLCALINRRFCGRLKSTTPAGLATFYKVSDRITPLKARCVFRGGIVQSVSAVMKLISVEFGGL